MRDALRFSPKLLLAAEEDPDLASTTIAHNGHSYPSLVSPKLGFSIMFNPDDYLPYIVRAYEYHEIYGNSTSDLILHNYTTAAGVSLPRRFKVAYNEADALIDVLFSGITANPAFNTGFFEGLPPKKVNQTVTQLPPSPGTNSSEYGTAEVFEYR